MNTALRIFVVAAALVAVPLTIGTHGQVMVNDAACQSEEGGTCCYQSGSTCYPNSCSQASCAEQNKYWKETGAC